MIEHFRQASFATRVHVGVRWRIVPFRGLLAHVPPGGSAVDVGCGHGLWPLVLGDARPAMTVIGVDPDAAKIDEGRRAANAARLHNVELRVGTAEELPAGTFDVVSLVDVLYLLPPQVQESVLRASAAALAPGGRLLVKEISDRPRWKALWNRVQETLSVRVFKVTMGGSFWFRSDEEWVALLSGMGLRTNVIRLDRGYVHPHVVFAGERR